MSSEVEVDRIVMLRRTGQAYNEVADRRKVTEENCKSVRWEFPAVRLARMEFEVG